MNIRDRIKELRRVRAGDLKPSPSNWRTHPRKQRDALRGVLAEIGYADALVARELPDGTLELVDGHLRAETTPDMDVPVLVTDLTEGEASTVLATLDPLAAMAEPDPAKLDALLREVETSNEAVAALLTDLAEGAGVVPTDGGETKLVSVATQPPPKMAWVLIGIPTVRYGEIAEVVEKVALIDGVLVETTANNGDQSR